MNDPISIPLPILGVVKTLDDEHIPQNGARDCENWLYRDREFRVRPGLTTFGNDINQRPAGFISYDDVGGNRRIVMGTDDGWWTYDEATNTWTDISGTALTASFEQQVFRFFQVSSDTHLLGVNGKDSAKTWDSDPTTNYAAIGGTPPIARCMMILADSVLLGNLSSGATINPAAIDVSNRLDFNAGYGIRLVAILANALDIIAMEEMGDFVGAIYCADSIWLAIAQGGNTPFRFEPKKRFQEGDGPASTLSVAKRGNGSHVYLSRSAHIKQFDGAGLETVWPEASAYIRATANIATIGRAWAAYDSENREVLFVYPEKGNFEPNLGVIVKESTGAAYPVRWPGKMMTAGGFAKVARGIRIGDLTMPIGSISQTIGELGSAGLGRRIILGESGGQSYESIGDDDAGTGIPFFAETGLNNLGSGTKFKTVQMIEHRFTKIAGSQTVTVKIGKSNSGAERTLSSGHDIDIGSNGPYKTGHRKSSKFLSVRLEGTATRPVVWRGSFAHLVERGGR